MHSFFENQYFLYLKSFLFFLFIYYNVSYLVKLFCFIPFFLSDL